MREDRDERARPSAALVAAMERIVAGMDPETRAVFLLHRLEGWPYERIAGARGLAVADVERHIAEAIATLDIALARLGL